jgi:hypothetical protein
LSLRDPATLAGRPGHPIDQAIDRRNQIKQEQTEETEASTLVSVFSVDSCSIILFVVHCTTSLALEVEEGRMHLNDPVDKYLSLLREGGDIRRVTLEQLATHTSSLPRTPGSDQRGPHQRGAWDHQQVMEWLVHWRAPYPPGTKSLYSNLAVGVLGDGLSSTRTAGWPARRLTSA